MRTDAAFYSAKIYFSYGQLFVFDTSVKLPGCAWTEGHSQQGFARREKNVCFGTLLEFGRADVFVHLGPYEFEVEHQRVIEVPIEVPSGEILVAGPEEFDDKNIIKLAKGSYRLVAAQSIAGADSEVIDLYFEQLVDPISGSKVILCDDALKQPNVLLEDAEVA